MIKPALNILDRFGWLDALSGARESLLMDIGMLLLGAGMYGYRVAGKLKEQKQANEAATRAATREEMGHPADVGLPNPEKTYSSGAVHASSGSDLLTANNGAGPNGKVTELLQADFIGRAQSGLL